MGRTIPFHFVDVFAVEPLTGNSLAVVDGGAELSLELMQNIAREFNQSETTFVLPPTRADADWKLRSFTPKGVEVFGAGGHNTLGAWWWLAAAGRLDLGDARIGQANLCPSHKVAEGGRSPFGVVPPNGSIVDKATFRRSIEFPPELPRCS
jgi:PhzF family phenazine biosynthesis protein